MAKKTKNTINFGGITLNIVNDTGEAVPCEVNKIKLATGDKKALAIAVKNNIPALLIGETGTGKTSAIKELAYILKQRYTRISLSGYTTPDELIGSKSFKDNQTYYENGILTKAMLEGHICVLDELNAITPDTSFIIHSLLDDERKIALPNGDIIKPHKNFRLFATINPDYEGTKTLNRAFLDRFGILIYIDILTASQEQKLLEERTGLPEKTIQKLIAIAWLNRKAYSEQKTSTLISTRSLLQTCELIHEGLTPKEAYITAIVNKARSDEKRAFLDFYNAIFTTNDSLKDTMPQVLTPEQVKYNADYIDSLIRQAEDFRKQYNELYDKTQNDPKIVELQKVNDFLENKIKNLEAKIVEKSGTRTQKDDTEVPF